MAKIDLREWDKVATSKRLAKNKAERDALKLKMKELQEQLDDLNYMIQNDQIILFNYSVAVYDK
jgi:hypothetical protein